MNGKDYYETLGVGEEASDAEIKRAFRRLAKEYHPDRSRGDPAKERRFKEANEAYDVLSDAKKRAQYDQVRKFGFDPSLFGGVRTGAHDAYEGFGDLGSIFARLFGAGFEPGGGGYRGPERRTRPRPEPGAHVRTTLKVPFAVVLKGGASTITYTRRAGCQHCQGTGSKGGAPAQVCPQCQGTGRGVFAQGGFGLSGPCARCYGRGQVIEAPCPQCAGQGLRSVAARRRIEIPRGVPDGRRLVFGGEGHEGRAGGSAGDLIVTLATEASADFARQGDHLLTTTTVDLAVAALGGSAAVKTPAGSAELRLPPGTQPGAKLRLRGQGLGATDRPGDLIVTVQVRIPTELTPEQRRALEAFRDAAGPRQTTADERR